MGFWTGHKALNPVFIKKFQDSPMTYLRPVTQNTYLC